MVHTLQIVDSIASSPTVRLDLNDDTIWKCIAFDAPPPRLRRSVSANAMRDGIYVSSSNYEARTVRLGLQVFRSTADLAATQMQTLARELDRTDNYLKYQFTGASKPVFFPLYRSDFGRLEEIRGQASAFQMDVDLLAEPFALGLRETLGPFTVNNDPAAGSNGLYVDVTGVIGDVAAPCVITDANANRAYGFYSVRQHGTPSSLTFFAQAESITLGTDTTNPGGGPDAAMSGTGTNNYVRTSFTTASMATRLTWSLSMGVNGHGTYRVIAVVRRSDSTSVMRARYSYGGVTGESVTLPLTTSRSIVDLGLLTREAQSPAYSGYSSSGITISQDLAFQAARDSGAGTLDWDFVAIIPADESYLTWFTTSGDGSVDLVFDGINEVAFAVTDSSVLFSTGATNASPTFSLPLTGGFPQLVPNQTNRIFTLTSQSTSTPGVNSGKGTSQSLSLDYWPRYLHVRPSGT